MAGSFYVLEGSLKANRLPRKQEGNGNQKNEPTGEGTNTGPRSHRRELREGSATGQAVKGLIP